MQKVASLTAELAAWVGISATPRGNLLTLSTGVLGVEEACSGVRSLQSMLMASLFLGELHRLKWPRRLALIAVGLLLALICNIGRTLILVTVASRNGLAAASQWHDPAGFSVLFVSFGLLCLVVRLFESAPTLRRSQRARGDWRPLSPIWVAGILAWIALTEAATEVWYRSHETNAVPAERWTVRWPETRARFQDKPVNPKIRAVLAYSEGREATWESDDQSRWALYFFKWYPSRVSTLESRQHRPEVCMPAEGRVLVEERTPITMPVGGQELPFRVYHFDDGHPLYVFFCFWEERNRDRADTGQGQANSRENRLERVRLGQRNLGQQSVEVIVSGIDSAEAAEAAFRRQMEDVLVAQPR
jgi:exosortase/archaeosortase family protein